MGKAKEGDKRIGNQFWRQRSKHGRDKLFATPNLLWVAATEYFDWCDTHPLKEEKAFHYQGKTSTQEVSKMRSYTLSGLCIYLGCSENYFNNFDDNNKDDENKKEFMEVIARIRTIIFTQKFEGAAAGLLETNFIAYDLGFRSKENEGGNNLNVNIVGGQELPD